MPLKTSQIITMGKSIPNGPKSALACVRNQQRSEGASLGESSALNNPSTDLRWRQNKRCFSLCDWHQMGPAPTNSKQVPINMPPQFARSQLFPYTLLEMFGAARGNLLFPSSVFHDLKDGIPALLVFLNTHLSPAFSLSFLNKFCQSWRMTQCCLTNPSNYYTYRSAFECSPHHQHLRNTYRKSSVEARRCISQPLLRLYVMLLFRCSSFMDLHHHRGFQAGCSSLPSRTAQFHTTALTHLAQKQESPLPFKHLPEQRAEE